LIFTWQRRNVSLKISKSNFPLEKEEAALKAKSEKDLIASFEPKI